MWPTLDGVRKLVDEEAALIRKAANEITKRINNERTQDNLKPFVYGIDWFDQWEPDQQIWLIEKVMTALLSDQSPPDPAAMWEATIDIFFLETLHQIEKEIDCGSNDWRELVTRLLKNDQSTVSNTNLSTWRSRVTQLSDRILANPSYQKAEAFRDDDPKQLKKFLKQRCLPEDFLDQIPPVR
ncbi:MAG: hypothetical protein AAGG48_13965 [Planctomycetota bacterium]